MGTAWAIVRVDALMKTIARSNGAPNGAITGTNACMKSSTDRCRTLQMAGTAGPMVVYRVGSEPSEYATIYVRDTEEFLMKFEEIR